MEDRSKNVISVEVRSGEVGSTEMTVVGARCIVPTGVR